VCGGRFGWKNIVFTLGLMLLTLIVYVMVSRLVH